MKYQETPNATEKQLTLPNQTIFLKLLKKSIGQILQNLHHF